MTGDTTLTISVIVLIIGVLLNVYGFFNGRRKDIKSEAGELYDMRESLVKLNMKTDQICTSMNELRVDIRGINSRISEVEKEVTSLKLRIASAFESIDELKTEVKK